MEAKELLKNELETSAWVLHAYLEGMSTDEIKQAPAEGANPLAWQLGHMIVSEHQLLQFLAPEKAPALPENFSEIYSKEQSQKNDPSVYLELSEYEKLLREIRTGLLEIVASADNDFLTQPSPEPMQSYAANIGFAISLQAGHYYMHSGQVAVLRRHLGKPIVL